MMFERQYDRVRRAFPPALAALALVLPLPDAGVKQPSAAPYLRITETPWFRHKHDEVPASLWKNPKVKGPANCGACHTGAENGNYSERTLRLPK